jgi:hypothetical protein
MTVVASLVVLVEVLKEAGMAQLLPLMLED